MPNRADVVGAARKYLGPALRFRVSTGDRDRFLQSLEGFQMQVEKGELKSDEIRAAVVSELERHLQPEILNPAFGLWSGHGCVGLVLAVAEDLCLRDIKGLPIRRSDVSAPDQIDRFLRERLVFRYLRKDSGEAPLILEPGDVARLRLTSRYVFHLGILSESDGEPSLIHFYSMDEADSDGVYGTESRWAGVIETHLDESWLRRIVGVFSFPGITDTTGVVA